MASSYRCENGLPLRCVWINETQSWWPGGGESQPLLTRIVNHVLHPLPLLQNYPAAKWFSKCLPLLTCLLSIKSRCLLPLSHA